MEQRTLAQKLLGIQKKIGVLTKDSSNPFFRSKYADLNQVLDLAKDSLHPEGLFLSQGPNVFEGRNVIETSIIDADTGQSIVCRVPFSGHEKNMQEIGAATTYGRRFGIVSLLALEQVDDDGETVVGRGGKGATADSKKPLPATPNNPSPQTTPIPKEVSKGPSRETVLKQIQEASKVIIDSKRDTFDNIVAMLAVYKVSSKEELTNEQAQELLGKLKEILKK